MSPKPVAKRVDFSQPINKTPEEQKPIVSQVTYTKPKLQSNAALVPCRVCNKEIASAAKICPHCGIDRPGATGELNASVQNGIGKFEDMARIVAVIMFVIIFLKCSMNS